MAQARSSPASPRPCTSKAARCRSSAGHRRRGAAMGARGPLASGLRSRSRRNRCHLHDPRGCPSAGPRGDDSVWGFGRWCSCHCPPSCRSGPHGAPRRGLWHVIHEFQVEELILSSFLAITKGSLSFISDPKPSYFRALGPTWLSVMVKSASQYGKLLVRAWIMSLAPISWPTRAQEWSHHVTGSPRRRVRAETSRPELVLHPTCSCLKLYSRAPACSDQGNIS